MSATAEPFFVTDVLGAGSLGYGLLITAWTLGMAAGAAGVAHRVATAGVAAAASAAIGVQGLGIAGAAVAPVLGVALLGFALGGVAHGVKNVLLRTLIHERVPDALRGARPEGADDEAAEGERAELRAVAGAVVGGEGAAA